MFTGIIQEVGTVAGRRGRGDGAKLLIRADSLSPSVRPGDSLAVSGVCLTAVEVSPPEVAMDVLGETLQKSNLGSLRPGDPVNLEIPLKAGQELGGHFVTGHVDGVGKLLARRPVGNDWEYRISLSPGLLAGTVLKGSLAVEGVSLTVAALTGDSGFVQIIPFTFARTNLGRKSVGDVLNIETDILGKYVAKYLAGKTRPDSNVDWKLLKETGFLE